MRIREEFEQVFGAHALQRPLFYRRPGGIRFELSEGGSSVDQFLTALGKAQAICDAVFADVDVVTVVLSTAAWGSRFCHRSAMQALRAAGVEIPRDRCLWTQSVSDVGQTASDEVQGWIRLAFRVPKRRLRNLLWCALSSDLAIEPSPGVGVFLANLDDRVLVFPYDDRGMDVVGPNHERLASLYREFRSLTLEYDREQMEATFNAA